MAGNRNRGVLEQQMLKGLTAITAILGIPVLIAGVWLTSRHHLDCLRFLDWPVMGLGSALILLASLLGVGGTMLRSVAILWFYFIAMLLLMAAILAFTIFTLLVSSRGGEGHGVAGAAFVEYHLHEFSPWLRNAAVRQWRSKLRICVEEQRPCDSFVTLYHSLPDLYNATLTPLQAGCCKPPISCGFTFESSLKWLKNATTNSRSDCGNWSNEPMELCFECSSCKAGMLKRVDTDWMTTAKIIMTVLIFLFFIYCMAFIVFLDVRRVFS